MNDAKIAAAAREFLQGRAVVRELVRQRNACTCTREEAPNPKLRFDGVLPCWLDIPRERWCAGCERRARVKQVLSTTRAKRDAAFKRLQRSVEADARGAQAGADAAPLFAALDDTASRAPAMAV